MTLTHLFIIPLILGPWTIGLCAICNWIDGRVRRHLNEKAAREKAKYEKKDQ